MSAMFMGVVAADEPRDAVVELFDNVANGNVDAGSYIVVLKDAPPAEVSARGSAAAAAVRASAAALRVETERDGAEITEVYEHALNGFAAQLTGEQVAALRADPKVAFVEPDGIVRGYIDQTDPTWGLDRIDQRSSTPNGTYSYTRQGTGVDVYVLDSGIRSTHTQFGGRVGPGVTAIDDGQGAEDCNGHGTHVAGTVAGSTYGVAKNVNLTSVRVLGCENTGTTSNMVAGLDWIVANASGPSVVNASIGIDDGSFSVDAAIQRTVDAGITVVVAGGNLNVDACKSSPSRVLDAISVGATTSSNSRSSYSNYGPCIDIFAPGSSVTSAWYTDDTVVNTISGTSMASPHVAGVAALYLGENPTATPAEVAEAIVCQATQNVVQNVGPRTPNLLLYSNATTGASPSGNLPATAIDMSGNTAEGAAHASALNVEFTTPPQTPVTITWSVTAGSANPATDLTRASGSATVCAATLGSDLTYPLVSNWIVDDLDVEGNETVQVTYTISDGLASATSTTNLVITDNDNVLGGSTQLLDNFEIDRGWAIGNNAVTGNWEVAPMNASPALENLVYQVGSAVSGTNALVTGGLAGEFSGEFDVDSGTTTAQRTVNIPADATFIEVSNYLAHAANSDLADVLEIRIGDDIILQKEGAAGIDKPAAWSTVRADVSQYRGQSVVLTASVGDLTEPSLVEAAIDDIILYRDSSVDGLFLCSADAAVLSWTDASQSLYWVYKSTDGGNTFSWVGRTLGATTFTDPNPTVGAIYQVHYAGLPRVTCDTLSEPVVFTCSATGPVLDWTDASQSLYWVYKSVDGGTTYNWIGRTLGATTFTDPAPTAGALYQVHYAGIPRVVCDINFSCASSGASLSWTDAAQNLYWVYKSVNGGATYNWIGRTTGATNFTDPNPTAGALYQVHYAGIPRENCVLG